MKLKETLVGLVAALTIGGVGSGCLAIRTLPYEGPPGMPHRTTREYENNNNSLDDDSFDEVMRSVEMIRVSADYLIQSPFIAVPENPDASEEDTNNNNIQELRTSGSGIVLFRHNGYDYVLTNFHVVNIPDVFNDFFWTAQRVSEPEISIGEIHGIEMVYHNEHLDSALLRVPRNDASYPLTQNNSLYMGDSNSIRIGDFLCAVGYSLGAGNFLTQGSITNLGEFELDYTWPFTIPTDNVFLFQTPISPGNSGGPLLTVDDGNMYLVGFTMGYLNGLGNNVGIRINEIMEDIVESNIEIPIRLYRDSR